MKKLKLIALQINAKELLTREQMKAVYGGSGDGSGSTGGTCCVHSNDWSGYQCGLSRTQALDFFSEGGWDKWCCDSCASSSGYPF